MTLFDIPFPGEAPDIAGSLGNRGSISLGAQEAEKWESVSRLGAGISNIAGRLLDERMARAEALRRRQDQFALNMASLDLDQARDAARLDQDKRTDLHTFDKEGRIGFDRSVGEYGDYIDKALKKASGQIPSEYRDLWMAQQDAKNREAKILFEADMVKRKVAYQESQYFDGVRRLATGETTMSLPIPGPNGEVIPVRVPINPQAALTFAQDNIGMVTQARKQEALDYALEQVTYGLMNEAPQQAVDFLEKAKQRFEPQKWRSLMDDAQRRIKKDEQDEVADADGALASQRSRVIELLDADDPNRESEFKNMSNLVGVADDTRKLRKENGMGLNTALLWSANRNRKIDTDFPKAVGLMGEVIKAMGETDRLPIRLKMGDARYGEDGYLSQDAYDKLRGLLAKNYDPYAVASIQVAYAATARGGGRTVAVPGIMGGFAMQSPIVRSEDRVQQMGQFLSWFDSQIAKGNVPDKEQAVTQAMKLGVQMSSRSAITGMGDGGTIAGIDDPDKARLERLLAGRTDKERDAALKLLQHMTLDQFERKYRPTNADTNARREKLLEGLSDTDRDAVLKLLQTMSLDEFEKRYLVNQ